MKKMMNKKVLAMFVGAAALLALPLFAAAEDKLVVQDAGLNNVFTVDDTGLISGAKLGLGLSTPELQLHAIADTVDPTRGIMTGQHNDGAQAAIIKFQKSRGSYTSPTAMANGDYFGVFQSWGYDGSAYQRTAQFGFRTNGTVSAGNVPTDIVFWSGTNAASLTEMLRLKSTGTVNMLQLSGSYTGGSAYVCVNNAGDIYASEVACP
ncbi:hypothetical protein ACFLZ5_11085 [Thermodesulfobacteriota bacterium]